MSDMAHISGLVAAGVVPGPFEHSHVVTTTTHKSLRGPRGGMVFYRRDLKEAIDSAVFPVSRTVHVTEVHLLRSTCAEVLICNPWPSNPDPERAAAAVDTRLQGLQGGPHNHTISALAVALKQAASPEFKSYQQQVVSNCSTLAKRMSELGYSIVSGRRHATRPTWALGWWWWWWWW